MEYNPELVHDALAIGGTAAIYFAMIFYMARKTFSTKGNYLVDKDGNRIENDLEKEVKE